jgi:hypothetical protein
MDQELQRLKRLLREEKCPRHVLQKLERKIIHDRNRSRPRKNFTKLLLPVGALAAVVLAMFMWRPPLEVQIPAEPATVPVIDHAQVVQETKFSLACIGLVLLEAANSSETIIKERAVSPLRDGLEKITEPFSKQL